MPDDRLGLEVKRLDSSKLYLGIWIEKEFAGVWIIDLERWEFHTSLLPHTAGLGGMIARAGLAKMFGHGAPYLYTYAPGFNRAALLLARRLGFREQESNYEFVFYGGKRFPIHHFTLTKEDYYASCTIDRCGSRRSRQHLQPTQPEEASPEGC